MDITKIIESLGDILPVIIFVIIAIVSSRGKKRPGTSGQPPAPEPAQSSQEERGADDDELRGILDEIFQAKLPRPAKTPQEDPYSSAAKSEHRAAAGNEWDKTVAANKARDTAKAKAKAAERSARKAADAATTAATTAVYAVDRTHADVAELGVGTAAGAARTFNLGEYASAEQAGKGFVWSEILGTPVGMR